MSKTLESMLAIYLADLRSHVEEQLRRLADVQRLTHALSSATPPERVRRLAEVARDLSQFGTANMAMREVTAAALEAARTLQGATRDE